MKIHPLNTGNFKLDGGAMFGVVPKRIWQKTNPADSNNMCSWSMRSILIEEGDKLILVDTGMGDKQSEKFFSYYYLFGDDSLDGNLKKLGFSRDDITDVFLTHLHFDHCGGAIEKSNSKHYQPAFKNAKFWSNERHWKWATVPNGREKASFLSENILPIQESGQLNFVPEISEEDGIYKTPLGFESIIVSGHTDAQMCPIINYKGKTLVFMADLLPSVGHIPLPYVMGYDTRPLISLKEKGEFLKLAAEKDFYLFLQHDHVNEICTVKETEKGVRLDQTFNFKDIF